MRELSVGYAAQGAAAAAAEGVPDSATVPELGKRADALDQTLRDRLDFRPRLSPTQARRAASCV